MSTKAMVGNTLELRAPAFGKAREGLDSVDMMLSPTGERIVTVVAPEMAVDDAVDSGFAPDDGFTA